MLKVSLGLSENHRIPKRSGSSDVVNDLGRRDAAEIFVPDLKILLGSHGKQRQVLQRADFPPVDLVLREHLSVELRPRGDIFQLTLEPLLLIFFDFVP